MLQLLILLKFTGYVHIVGIYKRAIANMAKTRVAPTVTQRKRPDLAFEKSLAYQYPEVAKQHTPPKSSRLNTRTNKA